MIKISFTILLEVKKMKTDAEIEDSTVGIHSEPINNCF